MSRKIILRSLNIHSFLIRYKYFCLPYICSWWETVLGVYEPVRVGVHNSSLYRGLVWFFSPIISPSRKPLLRPLSSHILRPFSSRTKTPVRDMSWAKLFTLTEGLLRDKRNTLILLLFPLWQPVLTAVPSILIWKSMRFFHNFRLTKISWFKSGQDAYMSAVF